MNVIKEEEPPEETGNRKQSFRRKYLDVVLREFRLVGFVIGMYDILEKSHGNSATC